MTYRFATAMLLLLVPAMVCRADEAAKNEPPITKGDRDHWAFKKLSSPEVPTVGDTNWPRNEIDQFILARLRKDNLDPAPEADRETLLRRVTFDLTGLPPTPEEIEAFLADNKPGAYGRVVDRLLASKAYGERWGQHWLDLARFAESDGFEHDKVRYKAWKYRDWVIQALNDDMPYGEFVKLQIAGDLIRPDDEQAAIATGFGLCGPDMPDINLEEERRHMVLNDMSSTVGSVFLGLQMGCAECHDHKYDPISIADFYRLRAFFEPGLKFADHKEDRVLSEEKSEAATELVSYVRDRGDFRRPGDRVEPAMPRIAVDKSQPLPTDVPPRVALAEWLASGDNYLATRVMVNRIWQHHFGYGIVRSPSDFGIMGYEPTHPELLDWLAKELTRQRGSMKAMHRLMVTSATYRQASHLEPGVGDEKMWQKAEELDPTNELLWRANRQRLEGEAIRDAMLAAAERLSPRAGGRGVMPPLPPELVETLLKNHWKVDKDEEDHRRRSIYLFVRRNLRYPIFEVFDGPDTNASCARRNQSTIAPQSLLLLNSENSLEMATELAKLVAKESPGDLDAQITGIYLRSVGRVPSADQLDRATQFVAERVEHSRTLPKNRAFARAAKKIDGVDRHELAALSYLSLAMFNTNEFVYVD